MSTEKVVSTLVLEVNLRCEKCYKKVQKVLCEMQQKENIRKIDYDNTKNTITISGPFDPHCLAKKLRCKVCSITDIKIVPPEQEKTPGKEKKENTIIIFFVAKCKDDEPKPPACSSTTTVNLNFTNVCGICYPWPCSNPKHKCDGQQQPPQPPCPPPGHHQDPQCCPAPRCSPPPCRGPSSCGGCCCKCRGPSCSRACPPKPVCCPGPSSCSGCNGGRIVHENKCSYETYPAPGPCAIM